MKKIPQKYLYSTNQREARAFIRQCLASGMTVKDMAAQLTTKYRTSGAAVREHLGKLLSIIYDFDSPKIACHCARFFGINLIDGLSVSESVYIEGYSDNEQIFKRKEFSSNVTSYMPVVSPFPSNRWPLTVAPSAHENVLTISSEHNIYAVMGADNELNLFILEPCPNDILIDEDVFDDEEPLYFTEHSHFTSPVFRINLANRILDYCLAEIGYPHIPVKKKVIFTSHEANLMNLDDYRCHSSWLNVEVIMLKSIVPAYAINKSRCILDKERAPKDLKNQLREMLFFSISATAMLYESVCSEKLTLSVTPKTLSALCKRNYIFA